jgi:predicted nucleic acid-binding protein
VTTDASVLIDTSAWIEALRPSGSSEVRDRVAAAVAAGCAVTTQLVVMELLIGARTDEQYGDLEQGLSALRHVSIDGTTWRHATRMGFELRRGGLSIPTTDLLIAAVALANDAIVLHADRHFDLIASRSSLKVDSMLALLPAG